MSTYTPNLNLYKPDATDPVSEFRAEFNNNMDKIDSGGGGGSSSLAGLSDVSLSSPSNNQVLKYNSTSQKWENQNESGGGSGGHTIYDPNGTAMTQRSGLQFTGNVNVSDDNVNGKTIVDILSGGGGGGDTYYGFAIDETNKLFEGEITNFNQAMSYTATEDAIVLCWYYGNAGYQHLYINGEAILIRGNSANSDVSFAVPIRRGDVVSSRYLSSSQSCYFRMVVYGIKQGTKIIQQNYTTTEQVVGTWMGKPLYQISIPFSGINTYANTWYALNISSYLNNPEIVFNISDMDYYFVSGVQRMFSNTSYEPPNMLLQTNVNRTNISGHVTVRYTKTTD